MNHRPKTPGVLNPSSDPLYEHLNDDSDTFGVNVYLAYWSAQTFRSPDTHIINKVCLKGFHIGIVEHVATIGIQATDEAGEPTGEDLTYTTFSTHLFKKDTPAEWQCIDIPEIELAGGVMYAIVVRVPTAGVGDRLVLRKTLDSGYPNGRAWESTNGGVTWGGNARWCYQFEEWGEPPAPPPPPGPPGKWCATTMQAICLADGYTFVAATNKPVHLWLRTTDHPTRKHLSSELVRGETKMTDLRFCFTVYADIEQEEAGDTLEHTFIVRTWPVPQTRYFYLIGTIDEVPSPSTSNIFTYHFPPKPYRNELTDTPTSSDRAYSDQGVFAIFYPPMNYYCRRLAACLSKENAYAEDEYPDWIYLEVRTAPGLNECGELIALGTIPTFRVPVQPLHRWEGSMVSGVSLKKGEPYAFIVKSSEPLGTAYWGLAARMELTECIMSPTVAGSFVAANPCQPATDNISPLFLSAPERVPTPKGEYYI